MWSRVHVGATETALVCFVVHLFEGCFSPKRCGLPEDVGRCAAKVACREDLNTPNLARTLAHVGVGGIGNADRGGRGLSSAAVSLRLLRSESVGPKSGSAKVEYGVAIPCRSCVRSSW